MEDYIIKVENLTKRFGKNIIFDKVNVEFKKGESVAILGNNGMGKSTFLRIISGLTSLSSGKIIIDRNVKFNYIPENYSKLNLTIEEYLKCIGDLDNIRKEEFEAKVKELYEKFYLKSMKDVPMKNLSKGSLQKVAVIQALISNSDVLLLDEPLSGQDVNSQANFIRIIKDLISEGVTVIMSCHEPFLVDELSSRVLKIENKKIIESVKPKIERVRYNILIFEKKEKSNIDKLTSEFGDILECHEEEGVVKLKVRERSSNKVLLSALNYGFTLKYFK
ncbi:ATP-binding cassette domain-containing protein [Clostridium cibarium]|uniref:ABC transporter ATP-binding protein n=1 Tax=Clostridium cibarium TaxID=2762247 RepID=A0ABR8PVM7_9CLOT|nr:ABC transporter ATP-binding protein [Clostridium cibarium]MBD7912238.1 ABC transporter ATP-binding protein [Clostridium cibarium]